ncbi:C40 family peptidase [Sphingomonas donggukensis]|uniref:C40 family peptidase n=1 Tax=Sphingomonas donggukensis TaxID=2949093 RepID=A0ABY4TVL0_9SPHN|nr:NlpC/P60 family protein [Sphingomonas donggukensis]URW76445.1 C40 family peptidase [Sphingomonas donggukensis]
MTDHRPKPAQPTRKRFALTGHSHAYDPRVDAARGDLADLRLADRIFAPHYAKAVARNAVTRAPLLAAHGGDPVSEVLQGERFDVLELSHGYAWGMNAVDGAVGFVAMDALGAPFDATHVVCAPKAALPMGSRLSAGQADGFDAAAIRPLEAPAKDYVALAESLVGTPVVAGGRSSAGIDGAGLVSLALSLAGIRAPRFADIQADTLGHAVDADAPVLRGDLLFHGGDVAIAIGESTAIHAGAETVARSDIAALGPIDVRRRLP